MKTYSLNQDFFSSFTETCETLDYLDSVFPSLLTTETLSNYSPDFISRNNPANRMAITLAFREILEGNGNKVSEAMCKSRDSNTRQIALNGIFCIPEDDVRLSRVNIQAAITDNMLVESNLISFTSAEVNFIKANLANLPNSDNLYNNIIEKINGKQ